MLIVISIGDVSTEFHLSIGYVGSGRCIYNKFCCGFFSKGYHERLKLINGRKLG
jgi:hypothetical protein